MKRQGRELLTIGVVLILITGACATPPTPVPTATPLDVVSAFQAAYNKKDIEQTAALLADNISYRVAINGDGKKATLNILEFQFAINTQWTKNECQLDSSVASRVKCKTMYIDDCQSPKIQAYRTDFTFQLSEGKLTEILGTDNPDDIATFGDVQKQRDPWAKANMPAEWAKYADTENWWFNHTDQQPANTLSAKETGQVWDRICIAYSQATK